MKRKIILVVIVVIIIIAIISLFGPSVVNKIGVGNVVTSSQLEKAIDIDQLSTAEFVYNGIAEKYKDDDPEEIECYISYNANVKIGVSMQDIKFEIDKQSKTVTPILPEIKINSDSISFDENSISYIPENPDILLKDIISCCEEDAREEAQGSKELHQTAEENLKAVIEGLSAPILEDAGYQIDWQMA